jgi:hypothetical protein
MPWYCYEWKFEISCITNVIIVDIKNTRHNIILDKELDLIAKQDDQEVKHKNLTKYIELEGI